MHIRPGLSSGSCWFRLGPVGARRSPRPSIKWESCQLGYCHRHMDWMALSPCARSGVVGVGLAACTGDQDLDRASALRILEVGLQGLADGLRP